AIAGSGVTAWFAKSVPVAALLVIAALLLEISVFCVRRLARIAPTLDSRPRANTNEKAIGGGVLSGMTHAFKSPYFANIVIFMLLFAITSTFLYFQQAGI